LAKVVIELTDNPN